MIQGIKRLLKASGVVEESAERSSQKAIAVIVISSICLTMAKYFGDLSFFSGFVEQPWQSTKSLTKAPDQLIGLIHWVTIILVFYFLVPAALIKLILKEKLVDYGISAGDLKNGLKIFLLILAVMIPLVLAISFNTSFQNKYPFYHIQQGENLWPWFWTWEIIYLVQFFCVEFFFRGFMVHGLKESFGRNAVYIMTIPYCMIHFGKPMPETLAAIAAGIFLGHISLKSKSIWMGVALHYSVAITMDFASLWQKELLIR